MQLRVFRCIFMMKFPCKISFFLQDIFFMQDCRYFKINKIFLRGSRNCEICLIFDRLAQWRAQDLFQQGQKVFQRGAEKRSGGADLSPKGAENFSAPPPCFFFCPSAKFDSAPPRQNSILPLGQNRQEGGQKTLLYLEKSREKHLMIDHSAISN